MTTLEVMLVATTITSSSVGIFAVKITNRWWSDYTEQLMLEHERQHQKDLRDYDREERRYLELLDRQDARFSALARIVKSATKGSNGASDS